MSKTEHEASESFVRAQPAGVTEQQLQVLSHLSHGATHVQVAGAMHVSVATVSYHVERLKQLTGQKTMPAVVAFAFVHQLLSVEEWSSVA